jgi:DNA-binding response OmpR family regulator
MMSMLDGFELTKRIRKNPKTSSIPIILLSALTSDEKRIHALKIGADAYLTKPFHTQELLTRCQNLLYRHDQLRQSYAGETIERREVLPEIIMEERERKFIKDLDALIRSNMTNPNLSVEFLAEKLHFGRTMFFKQVKSLTGETPADYIRIARLRYAAELLSGANGEKLTVSEVSYQVGIDDPHYFIKLFKKQYGITPKKYQQGGQSEQKDT